MPFLSLPAFCWAFPLAAERPDSDTAIRLVDTFRPQMVKGTPASVAQAKPVAFWDFAKPSPEMTKEAPETAGWKAGIGVSGLALRNGRLVGHSTEDFPIIYFSPKIDSDDLVYSVEIRMRASKGANLSVSGGAGPGRPRTTKGPNGAKPGAGQDDSPDFKQIVGMGKQLAWPDTTPIIAGDSFQTYTIQVERAPSFKHLNHVFLRPTDVPDADFEIESMRIVSRREHLARIPSGLGWQGLAEIYRETLVTRSPETIDVEVDDG